MKTSRAVLATIMFGLALGAVSVSASAAGYHGGGYSGGGHYSGGHYGGGYYGGGHYGGGYYGHYHGYYGPRVAFGFYGPWWGPGYWGPGYYGYGYGWGGYAPPVVVVPSEPSVYVERDAAGGYGGQQQWWYWCPGAKGYYPYVSTCAEGWQRVAPQPSQAPQ